MTERKIRKVPDTLCAKCPQQFDGECRAYMMPHSDDEYLQRKSDPRALCEERDLHAESAAKIYGVPLEEVTEEQRDKAKMINFGFLYGGMHDD